MENRYEVTSLARCNFRWQLRRFAPVLFSGAPVPESLLVAEGTQAGPAVAVGQTGTLRLGLPAGWRDKHAEALAVTALSPAGRELWTWVYPLQSQSNAVPAGKVLNMKPTPGEWRLRTGNAELRIESDTGSLGRLKGATCQ